jgi:hypothetical protein
MCASRLHVSFESTIRTIEISNARVRILRRLHDENSTVFIQEDNIICSAENRIPSGSLLSFSVGNAGAT